MNVQDDSLIKKEKTLEKRIKLFYQDLLRYIDKSNMKPAEETTIMPSRDEVVTATDSLKDKASDEP